MRILLSLTIILFGFTQLNSQDTFSIVAVDTLTGEVGSAGASCIGAPQIPQGCYILSDVLPGKGVIHTQAYYLAANQNYAHQLMLEGLSPQQIVDSLVSNDAQNNSTTRQYGVVDFNLFTGSARTAAFTGSNCDDYKNHIIGPNYTIQGNILLGQQILDSMETRFLNADGELACKLMAALQGAKVIGADTRCLDDGVSSLSSFLRVAQPNDPPDMLYLDLNVPSTPDGIDPIDSLQSLIDIWGGCLASAIKIIEDDFSIVIFPNPSTSTINFRLNGNKAIQNGELSLFTLLGKQVISMKDLNGKYFQFQSNLSPGIYYYLLSENNEILGNGKVVIK